MKADALQALINNSVPFIAVEVRGKKLEFVTFTSQKDKTQQLTFAYWMLNVESLGEGAESFTVKIDSPKDAVANKSDAGIVTLKNKAGQDIECKFKKGDKVICLIRSMVTDKQHTTFQARQIEMLEQGK